MTTPVSDDLVKSFTFHPVSDSKGNQSLIVTIKSVPPREGDIPKVMERSRRSTSFDAKMPSSEVKKSSSDSKRKTRSRTLVAQSNNKSTMTEQIQTENQTSGSASGVASSDSGVVPASSGVASSRSGVDTSSSGVASSLSGVASSTPKSSPSKLVPKTPALSDAPCLKHAAENISRKASEMESEKLSLCNSCSKSMLSYIFVVQDFLDSLAKEIVGQSDTQNCIQCLRQDTRRSVSGIDDERTPKDQKTSKPRAKSSKRDEEGRSNVKEPQTRAKTSTREVRRYEETSDQLIERSLFQHRQTHQQDQANFNSSNAPNVQGNFAPSNQEGLQPSGTGTSASYVGGQQAQDNIIHGEHTGHKGVSQEGHQSHNVPHQGHQSHNDPHQGHQTQQEAFLQHSVHVGEDKSNQHAHYHTHADEPTLDEQIPSRRPFNRHPHHRRDVESSVFGDAHVDGVVSALSNAERQVYDDARNDSGFEGLGEDAARGNPNWEDVGQNNLALGGDVGRNFSGQGGDTAQGITDHAHDLSSMEGRRLVSSLPSPVAREAYVTMCRNNAEALGCLVVGTSLLLSRTTRTLCVLMAEGVSNAFRGPLSCVFHSVVPARSLDSLGSTKLSLMEQPELGVSFEKLNVWRLLQFDKCVYLNPDTLVLQNCDELFCRDELSAVSDVGWPDCFNSGVFVFVPSLQTFWSLVEYAEKNGSYDGGDQGLLNSYFSSWGEDISKKLSFIYNLMANVSYTYTPAFKQFGRNVKVVQFLGTSKPWHVKFFSRTGQISPETPVHPTYAQFVHVWINIFRVAALRQLSQDIKSYAQSQEVICAVELLRFFPLPSESEADFFLTPPSVRLRSAERRLHAPSKTPADARRRKSVPAKPSASTDVQRRKSVDVAERQIQRSDADVESQTKSSDAKTDVERQSEDADVEHQTIKSSDAKTDVKRQSESSDAKADVDLQTDVVTVEKPDEVVIPGSAVGNYQGMKAWEQGRMDYQGTDSSDTIIKRLQFLMEQPK